MADACSFAMDQKTGPSSTSKSTTAKKSKRWQFSISSVLAVFVLISGTLAWWFRPFVVETRRPSGSLLSRTTMRYDWLGNRHPYGEQTWFHPNGRIFARRHAFENTTKPPSFNFFEFDGEQWDPQGRPLVRKFCLLVIVLHGTSTKGPTLEDDWTDDWEPYVNPPSEPVSQPSPLIAPAWWFESIRDD